LYFQPVADEDPAFLLFLHEIATIQAKNRILNLRQFFILENLNKPKDIITLKLFIVLPMGKYRTYIFVFKTLLTQKYCDFFKKK
jgi:hypothetical protein